jgi:hypothetical protein
MNELRLKVLFQKVVSATGWWEVSTRQDAQRLMRRWLAARRPMQ